MERNVLYIGADDSNNHDSRTARVLATTFSIFHKDSIYRNFPREKNHKELFYWLGSDKQERDFRFALLTESYFNSMQPVLPLAIPKLALNYVPTLRETPNKVWISIDGILPRAHREYIRRSLNPYFKEIVINNVIKRRNIMARRSHDKKLFCPTVLKMADSCANHIYDYFSNSYLEERVVLDQSRLRDIYLELKAK